MKRIKMKKSVFFISVLTLFAFIQTNGFAQIRVVCVGNSITEGYSNSTQAKAWPAQLNKLLGSKYNILNCGASGTRMSKTVGPSYWNDGRFTTALNANPQILIISLGTNDGDQGLWSSIKSTFKKDYCAMIDTFRSKGRNPIIYTCLPPPVFANANQTANIRNEIIPFIREISALKGTYIIDYHTPLLSLSTLFPDGVHPNDEGSAVMADIASTCIKSKQLITPYVSINNADSIETTSSTVSLGSELTFKPTPVNGTWAWTGPNGFNSLSRVVTLSTIQFDQGGVYTAVYTNADGVSSVQDFRISIDGCTAANIIPYINAGGWKQATSATVNPGSSLSFGPQPADGTWTWTGPNGFFSNSREFTLNNIVKSQEGVYTATYYNVTGCKSTQNFTVTVEGDVVCPTLTSYISVDGVWKAAGIRAVSLKSGGSVKFGPQPSDGIWSWAGPNGFTGHSREASINNIQTKQAGIYTGTFTTVAGCIETIVCTVTVDGVSATEAPEKVNSEIETYPNPADDEVTLTNVPLHSLITVFDLCGQVLMQKKSTDENEIINISCLNTGSYYLKVGDGTYKTLKLLKK